MRNLGFLGLAAVIAMIPAAAGAAGDSRARMTVGHQGGWAGVPTVPLRAPRNWNGGTRGGAQGGWGASGWSGGGHFHGAPGPRAGHRWGNWAQGGAYRRPVRGGWLPRFYVGPNFFIGDWYNYGLGTPGYGQGWYRYYDDAVLLDSEGRVYDQRSDFDWDDDDAPPPVYGERDEDYYAGNGGPWRDDMVTWGHRWSGPPAVVYHAPPGTTTIVIQTAPVVTTTTTTFVEESRAPARHVWKAKRKWHAKKVWHPKACNCGCGCR